MLPCYSLESDHLVFYLFRVLPLMGADSYNYDLVNIFSYASSFLFAMSPADTSLRLRFGTVAAFAVCIQSAIRPAESELSLFVCRPVCAWLIATRKKTACLFGQAAFSAIYALIYLIIPVCA